MGRRIGRLLRRLALSLVALLVIAALPIAWNETRCVQPAGPASTFVSQLDKADQRALTGTYYTYPEWAIVYGYQDLARVMRAESESSFLYLSAAATYWHGLCQVTTAASQRAPTTFGERVVSYIIGLSFSAEMLLKGAYESSIGSLAVWLRGPEKSAEDEFVIKVADDYAAFLELKPWYDFPFGQKLSALWASPSSGTVRGYERRLGYTLEWGGKAIYGSLMQSAAGSAMPFSTRIRSVVAGLTDEDIAAVPGITRAGTLPDGASIIETDRYRALTTILNGLALRGRDLREIAGNDTVLVSVLAAGKSIAVPAGTATSVFQAPVQGRPDVIRVGLEVPVAKLAAVMRAIKGSSTELELIYDFY